MPVHDPVPFSFDGHLIRVVSRQEGDWFVATDAARILGHRDAATAIRLLDPDEKDTHSVRPPGGPQELLVCSEPGLYKLIARSRRPKAQEFDRFVRHEILPAIRRTGRYEIDAAKTRLNPQAMNAASRVVGEVRRCQGPRAAAKALPSIYARAGITIEPGEHPQGELALAEKPGSAEDAS